MGGFRSRSRSRSYDRRRSRSRSFDRGRNNRRSASYDSRSPSPEEDGYRVHVADLGLDPSKRELETSFEKFGPITEVWVARNPPCFAFIVYKYREDADLAIREMDGRVLSGGRIRCSWARPRTRGRRRRGFDPNMRCYTCGERGHFSRDCSDVWSQRRNNRGRDRPSRRRRSRSRSRDQRSRDRRSRSRSGSRSKSSRRRKETSSSKSPRRERKESRSSDKQKSKSSDRDRNPKSSKWEQDGEENGREIRIERQRSHSSDRRSADREDRHSPDTRDEVPA